jgi:predicted nucleic acid-binding protein
MERHLIDTNAAIDYLAGKLPANGMSFMNAVVNDVPNLSVITKIKILSYNAETEVCRFLSEFIGSAVVMHLSETIIDRTIAIRKARKTRTPDAIIATTALENNLTLITRNIQDFQNIPGLTVINPWQI